MPPEMCAKSQVVTAGGCRGPRGPETCSDFTLGGGPGGGGRGQASGACLWACGTQVSCGHRRVCSAGGRRDC